MSAAANPPTKPTATHRCVCSDQLKEPPMPEPPTCCLCGSPCEPWVTWDPDTTPRGYGHNPEPLASGDQRCCNYCNAERVVPARLRQIHPSHSNKNRTN